MQSVELGKTGIVVSPLGVGAMSWGTKRALAYGGAESDDAEQEALGALLEAGVTLVDTAEMYRNEERIGALVNGHKEVVDPHADGRTREGPSRWQGAGHRSQQLRREAAASRTCRTRQS